MGLKYYVKDRVHFSAANEYVIKKGAYMPSHFSEGNRCGVLLKSLLQDLFLVHVFATYCLMTSKQTPNCILTSSQLFVAYFLALSVVVELLARELY